MAQVERLIVHPKNPQVRLVEKAAQVVRQGGVIAYPTDSSYAIGCHLDDKAAVERLRRIRGADRHHHFTLVCRDLSEIATYAQVDNPRYRLLRSLTPGPYTFILTATREVPRRFQHKRRTIGIRVPDNVIAQTLLTTLGEPVMSSTLIPAGETEPLYDGDAILSRVGSLLDLVLDGGNCGTEPTTVLDLAGEKIKVLRYGLGPVGDWI